MGFNSGFKGLRRESAAFHLLGLRALIPLKACMDVSCERCAVRQRSLRRTDHLSRRVLSSVVSRNV